MSTVLAQLHCQERKQALARMQDQGLVKQGYAARVEACSFSPVNRTCAFIHGTAGRAA